MDKNALPLGFGMALAQNEAAMQGFESLTEAEKEKILAQAHNVRSKDEMATFVSRLNTTATPYREENR